MGYMTEVNKLRTEMRHLDRMLSDENAPVGMLVQQSKRVRTASSLLVKAVARHRDQLQPDKEGTSE